MTITLNPEQQAFLEDQVRSGKYPSAEAAISEAMSFLKLREEKIAWLRRELQVGIDQLDRGEGQPWDVEELKAMVRAKHARA